MSAEDEESSDEDFEKIIRPPAVDRAKKISLVFSSTTKKLFSDAAKTTKAAEKT
eukprot:CAMPEP_0181124150 /NCGR_PEP_ID=MMETSP1071-20121207/26310_1 /TAXON_ID=35127 /ORGANISM="Thalassiosira sp., Strain NH16" /LENGTH=53 /DNA_ID=CAMNT_0023209401 /DNA_START=1 /DNA_END=158 /DNA_ORIENTATION=+